MKLLTLLSACKPIGVGLAGIAVIGGGTMATITASQPPENIVLEGVVDPVVEAVAEAPKEKQPEQKAEEKKEETPEPVVAPPKQSTTSDTTTKQTFTYIPPADSPNGPTGHAAAPSYNTPEPAKPTVKYKYTSVYEFEEAFRGVCPQDVPDDAWPDKLRPGVALGILHSAYGSKDPLAYADEIWSQMKEDPNRGFDGGGIWLFGSDLFDSLLGSDGVDQWKYMVGFTLNWSTKTVDWRRVNEDKYYKGKEGFGTDSDVYIKMERAAKQMTARIRQRESEFKAKCGY